MTCEKSVRAGGSRAPAPVCCHVVVAPTKSLRMVRTLYKLDASPPARAAMMTLEVLGLPVEYKDVNLFSGDHVTQEYLKLNPQHTIPALVDGDFSIWDSHAIAAYLVSKYAPDDSLYPKDLEKRALVDQRLHFDTGILFPAVRNAAFRVLFKGATSIPEERYEDMRSAYQFTDTFLEGRTYLAGDRMTIADICAVASISTLDTMLPIDDKKFPNLRKWLNKMSAEDFYVKKNLPGVTAFDEVMKSKLA